MKSNKYTPAEKEARHQDMSFRPAVFLDMLYLDGNLHVLVHAELVVVPQTALASAVVLAAAHARLRGNQFRLVAALLVLVGVDGRLDLTFGMGHEA